MYLDPFVSINLLMLFAGFVSYISAINKKGSSIPTSKLLGLLVLFLASILTSFIIRVIYNIDIIDSLLLFAPPLFYMYLYSRLSGAIPRYFGAHFIPAIIFALYLLIQPVFKNFDPLGILIYFEWIVLLYNTLYTAICFLLFLRSIRKNHHKNC